MGAKKSQRDSDGTYGPPGNADVEQAWRVTEALLGTLIRESRAGGAEFLLAIVSESRQAHPDAEIRQTLADQLGITDYFYYEDRLLDFADGLGMNRVGLSRPIRRAAEEQGACLHGFDNAQPCYGHWNEAGHALAGDLVAAAICDLAQPAGGSAARPAMPKGEERKPIGARGGGLSLSAFRAGAFVGPDLDNRGLGLLPTMGKRGGDQGIGFHRITERRLDHGEGVIQGAQEAVEQLRQLPQGGETHGAAFLREGPRFACRLGFLE